MNDLFNTDEPEKPQANARRGQRKEAHSFINLWLQRENAGRGKLSSIPLYADDESHKPIIEAFDMAKSSGLPERVQAVGKAVLEMVEITFEHRDQPKATFQGTEGLMAIAAGGVPQPEEAASPFESQQ